MKDGKAAFRNVVVNFLSYSFILGGAWLFIKLLELVVTIYYPSFFSLENPTPVQIFAALGIAFVAMFFGMITGLLFLLTIVRPFFEKEEMIEFIKPDVPFISVILKKHIENMYS